MSILGAWELVLHRLRLRRSALGTLREGETKPAQTAGDEERQDEHGEQRITTVHPAPLDERGSFEPPREEQDNRGDQDREGEKALHVPYLQVLDEQRRGGGAHCQGEQQQIDARVRPPALVADGIEGPQKSERGEMEA